MSPKVWRSKIRIVCAQTDIGKIYYLADENFDFIKIPKLFIDMIQSRDKDMVSPNTTRSYCNLLWYFVVFLKIHNFDFSDLDGKPELLVKFKIWLKNPYRFYENVEIISENAGLEYQYNKLSACTIDQIIDRVSSLYLWLKATNRIHENPVIYRNVIVSGTYDDKNSQSHRRRGRTIRKNSLKSSKVYRLPKVVGKSDFDKFLSALRLTRDKLMLLSLREGGFRIGELIGVKIQDIDFADQSIAVVFRPDNENGSRAKAGYGRDRVVHMPPALMQLIDTYISTEWINSDPQSDFLFLVVNSNNPIHNGKPMDKSTVDSMFKYYSMKVFGYKEEDGKKKPLKHFSPHMLRHTHATELVRAYIDNGESINWEYIANRLGHKSVTTTINLYVHLEKGDYKKEYERMYKYKLRKSKELTSET